MTACKLSICEETPHERCACAPPAMQFAYADPPYLGMCRAYDHNHGDDGRCWDDHSTHRLLIDRLCDEYRDGWSLSLGSVNLWSIMPLCPSDVRVGAWIKSFASFKPGVNPGYCWEPFIFRGGRRRTDKTEPTVRDFIVEPITLKRGLVGAKPTAVARWVLDMLGHRDGIDHTDDLYPGTNPIARALAKPVLA